MRNLRAYVIRQGDYLGQLAQRYGFDAEEIWNHRKNKPLQDAGRLPGVLHPGDALYIPDTKPKWMPITVGQANTFVVDRPRLIPLTLRFKTRDGGALAGAACVFRGLDTGKAPPPDKTDGNGNLELRISTRQGPFVVLFPASGYRFIVHVGHLDPVSELSGVRKRLENMGYGMSPILAAGVRHGYHAADVSLGEAMVRAFQDSQGLAPGSLNEDTREALKRAHGV